MSNKICVDRVVIFVSYSHEIRRRVVESKNKESSWLYFATGTRISMRLKSAILSQIPHEQFFFLSCDLIKGILDFGERLMKG